MKSIEEIKSGDVIRLLKEHDGLPPGNYIVGGTIPNSDIIALVVTKKTKDREGWHKDKGHDYIPDDIAKDNIFWHVTYSCLKLEEVKEIDYEIY